LERNKTQNKMMLPYVGTHAPFSPQQSATLQAPPQLSTSKKYCTSIQLIFLINITLISGIESTMVQWRGRGLKGYEYLIKNRISEKTNLCFYLNPYRVNLGRCK
jgi:hypothetical protein